MSTFAAVVMILALGVTLGYWVSRIMDYGWRLTMGSASTEKNRQHILALMDDSQLDVLARSLITEMKRRPALVEAWDLEFAPGDEPAPLPGGRAYTYRITGSDVVLTLIASDENGPVWRERIVQLGDLVAAGWNRRYDARHCPEHVWGEPFPQAESSLGPGGTSRMCGNCGITDLQWIQQVKEEHLRG